MVAEGKQVVVRANARETDVKMKSVYTLRNEPFRKAEMHFAWWEMCRGEDGFFNEASAPALKVTSLEAWTENVTLY